MKTAITAVLEAAPIFGGRIDKLTVEWCLLCPFLCVGSNCAETCSVWKVAFPKGQCGAVISSRILNPGLEKRLAAVGGPDAALSLSAHDLQSLIDPVGKGDAVANKGAMGANLRVCISQGSDTAGLVYTRNVARPPCKYQRWFYMYCKNSTG